MITNDKWVLNIVQEGLRLQFKELPAESGTRTTVIIDAKKQQFISEEVLSLLEKNAIEPVPSDQIGQGFYSTFFLVPKKDGGFRPILNLRVLNTYLKVPHFKMETLRSIVRAIDPGDWALSLDLKDAYLHVAMFPADRKFLRFCWQGQHYQFKAMPFGLAIAPRIFTKLMAVIGSYLRKRQIQVFMYLDDWLIKSQDRTLLLRQLEETLQLIQNLGLIVNVQKSNMNPSQVVLYLGSVFNTRRGLVLPSEERFQKIVEEIATISEMKCVVAQKVLRLLGLMASVIDLTPFARLHMRPIQFYLLSFWRPHKDSLMQSIPVKDTLLHHLEWWRQAENIFQGVSLQEKQPHSVTLWTDASTQGWGAHLEDHQISGVWSTRERDCHINWLEMRAVQLALIHFESILLNKRVLLRCDNSTVVSYVNREGGTKSFQLCCLVWEIFNWCKIRKIVIRAAHIPGKKNVLADDLSRGRQGVRITEWSLKQELVNQIFLRFSTPNIDLFATRENKKLPVFCSPFPDQLAWAVDALSVPWKGMFAYAFPPPVLIPQVLQKVRKEPCLLVLVAPHSPRQSWYPILLDLLVDIPRKLPITEDMLTQKKGQIRHADPESLNLVVWKISSLPPVRESFLQKLRSTLNRQEEPQHRGCTKQELQFTEAGVIDGIFVHIQPL